MNSRFLSVSLVFLSIWFVLFHINDSSTWAYEFRKTDYTWFVIEK